MGTMEGFSVADIMALAKDDNGLASGGGIWMIFFLFLLMGGRNGNLFGSGDVATQAALTRSDLQDGFNTQETHAQIRGIQNGLCDGFYAQNTAIMNGFHGVDSALYQRFAGTQAAITQLGYQTQQCCLKSLRAA